MVETIDIEQNKIIDAVAQFILVNSEVIDDNGLKGKMPLIYFLFCYGSTQSKPHYTEFAFEILEDLLIEEISIIEKHTAVANSKIAGMGWSLIKFIQDEYFESDDLEEILELIDTAVLLDLDILLIENEMSTDQINDLIIHGCYILERMKTLKDLSSNLNKGFQNVLLKLNENCALIKSKDYLSQVLCLELIKHEEIVAKNIFQLKRHIEKFNIEETKQTFFSSLLVNKAFEVGLVFNELYFKEDHVFEKNKDMLLKEIENHVNNLMEDLLEIEQDSPHQLFFKLISQALFLCNAGELEHKLFNQCYTTI